ncbi:hypothetical protein LWV32_25865 [Enterobacter asburiae]|uniref:hypothetical protein n=1 Tax=Enterobacter asburiae TaxID=61645 RepID=UPI000BA0B4D4|nr:hypothetical protein [Enterobacter asburiae]MCE1345164.1 hypothetical protein [Enterobacter asburiae]OZP65203.1 hypothetical protein CIG53_26075 [Enterobacter asburiae]QBB08330.1 hypothetical protein EVV94_25795 [Enterobacter cloacae]
MSNQPTSLPEEDIEFVMDTFQRSMGKSKPVRDTQIEGEKPQSKGKRRLSTVWSRIQDPVT